MMTRLCPYCGHLLIPTWDPGRCKCAIPSPSAPGGKFDSDPNLTNSNPAQEPTQDILCPSQKTQSPGADLIPLEDCEVCHGIGYLVGEDGPAICPGCRPLLLGGQGKPAEEIFSSPLVVVWIAMGATISCALAWIFGGL